MTFLTVADIAQRLRISRSAVYAIIATGKLATHRIGTGRGSVRISQADLDDYLESCRTATTQIEAPRRRRPQLKHLKA